MRSPRGGYESGPDSPTNIKPPTGNGPGAEGRVLSRRPDRRLLHWAVPVTSEGRVLTPEEFAALPQYTGQMIWLDHQDCEDSFGPSRASWENKWHARAAVGQQNGTYFRTARTHDGMTVWRWGRRD